MGSNPTPGTVVTADLGFIHVFAPGSGSRTLALLHGTGGDENDLLPLAKLLDPAASILSPRGQVLENGMPRFFRRLAMGVFDVPDLQRRTHDLAAFVAAAADTYGFAIDELVAIGYSNGANIAASLLLLHPGLVRHAALLHAMVPFEPDGDPDLAGTRVLLTAGEQDPYIPAERTRDLGRLLDRAGADVTLEVGPGGHELTRSEVDRARSWLLGEHPAR